MIQIEDIEADLLADILYSALEEKPELQGIYDKLLNQENRKHYRPIAITVNEVAGVRWTLQAMRRPKSTVSDSKYLGKSIFKDIMYDAIRIGPKDTHLAANLVKSGTDHAKAMRGIVVYFTIELQVGWMIEFETYRIGAETLSTSSSMHCELKNLFGHELAEKKQADLSDKVYIRDIMISYQTLRSMYRARCNHRHTDWKIWCDMIENLPYFDLLIFPEARQQRRKKR